MSSLLSKFINKVVSDKKPSPEENKAANESTKSSKKEGKSDTSTKITK